jgi:hypothetical protein
MIVVVASTAFGHYWPTVKTNCAGTVGLVTCVTFEQPIVGSPCDNIFSCGEFVIPWSYNIFILYVV